MEPPELDRLVHPVAAVDRRQESVALLAEQLRHGAEQQGVRGEGHQEGQHVGEPHDPHLPEEQEVADGALATGCMKIIDFEQGFVYWLEINTS